jgi:hypothetical protein
MRRHSEPTWGTQITFTVLLWLLAASAWLAGFLVLHAL